MSATLAAKFRDRIYFDFTYNPVLANRILAAGDCCVIPSVFEPCGQIDFIAQLNGNLPVAHRVGGLTKIEDGVTGFTYDGAEQELVETLERAIKVYRSHPARLRVMQIEAARRVINCYSWDKVFKSQYLPLYRSVIEKSKV